MNPTAHQLRLRLPACAATAGMLCVSVTLSLVTVSCARAGLAAAPPQTDDERLLPQIVRLQEEKVTQVGQQVQAAHDQARLVRLRQAALEQHGGADLATALDAEAQEREAAERRFRRQLADEEAALRAYRDYSRSVVPLTATPFSGAPAKTAAQSVHAPTATPTAPGRIRGVPPAGPSN